MKSLGSLIVPDPVQQRKPGDLPEDLLVLVTFKPLQLDGFSQASHEPQKERPFRPELPIESLSNHSSQGGTHSPRTDGNG